MMRRVPSSAEFDALAAAAEAVAAEAEGAEVAAASGGDAGTAGAAAAGAADASGKGDAASGGDAADGSPAAVAKRSLNAGGSGAASATNLWNLFADLGGEDRAAAAAGGDAGAGAGGAGGAAAAAAAAATAPTTTTSPPPALSPATSSGALQSAHRFHRRTPSSAKVIAHSGRFGEQMARVREILLGQRLVHGDRVENELSHFYDKLGLNAYYFETNSPEEVASHVSSLYAAKLVSQLNGTTLRLQLETAGGTRAVLVCRSLAGDKTSPALRLEPRIEEQYLGEGGAMYGKYGEVAAATAAAAAATRAAAATVAGATSAAGSSAPAAAAAAADAPAPAAGSAGASAAAAAAAGDDTAAVAAAAAEVVRSRRWKLHTYRTTGFVSSTSPVKLRFFFLEQPKYNPDFEQPQPLDETRLERIADVEWFRSQPEAEKELFAEVIAEVTQRRAPVIRVREIAATEDELARRQLLVGYRAGSTHNYLSGLTAMYHSLGYHTTDKFVEQFSNGVTVQSIFLRPSVTDQMAPVGTDASTADTPWPTDLEALKMGANAMYVLPRTSLSYLMREEGFTPGEHAYTYCAWKFAFHFLGRNSTQFAQVEGALSNNSEHVGTLQALRAQLKREAYTEGKLLEVIGSYPAAARACFADFCRWHQPREQRAADDAAAAAAAPPATPGSMPREDDELMSSVRRLVPSAADQRVFEAFLVFNRYTLKTNFFKSNKLAYSFRLDPAFLDRITGGFPTIPFGVFFVIGPEFRGFHIRFRDVSRGGIRLIRSADRESFTQNVTNVFDENYNLAHTQDRKNKDIPEGGSKGTILLALDHQDRGREAFAKYIDALLDLLLLPSPQVVDHSQREDDELLFLGPDEGTADLMDFACDHAKRRGYAYAMSFATGKTASTHGGIPHDTYGMTTRSVHSYVVGALERLGLDESQVTKVQTGGPDGDLGSNEIKISKDKTLAIVDGSGVLYDAAGLDRDALLQLAEQRQMGRHFPRDKLSDAGFFVDVNDTDVTLPEACGAEVVASGFSFRNGFHLHPLFAADVFVPCGGRPEAINIGNVGLFLHPKPRFRIIVEGANLFITQDARLQLEAAGVVLYKDASANKGGVTSSSLEVLAALALSPDEYAKHMCGSTPPPFYKSYVQNVISIVEENAKAEFNCIWDAHAAAAAAGDSTPRAVLSDVVSGKINDLSRTVGDQLWENTKLRRVILARAVPAALQELLGLDKVVERVPVSYMKAVFAAYLASRYCYRGVSNTPEIAFFEFLKELEE